MSPSSPLDSCAQALSDSLGRAIPVVRHVVMRLRSALTAQSPTAPEAIVRASPSPILRALWVSLTVLLNTFALDAQSAEFDEKVMPSWQTIQKETEELQCVVKGDDGSSALIYSSGANRLVRAIRSDGICVTAGLDDGNPWGAATKEAEGPLEYVDGFTADYVQNIWFQYAAPLFAAFQFVGPETLFGPLTQWDWDGVKMTGDKIVLTKNVEGLGLTTMTVFVDPKNRYRVTKWSHDIGTPGVYRGSVTYDGDGVIPKRVEGYNPIADLTVRWDVSDVKKCERTDFGPQSIGAENAPLRRWQWIAIGACGTCVLALLGWGLLRKGDN